MSFTYSQALVEAFSRGNNSDTEQCAPLKSSHTPAPFLWHDKTMALSHRSQFGMTCEPLTASLGAELLTWWLADSHARTLASQEKAQDLTAHEAGCGLNLQGLLAKYDPESHLLKTAQHSLLEDLTGCSVTLPRWGTMQNGALYPLPTLAHRTSASVYGFMLPAPVSSDATMGAVIGKNDVYYTTSTRVPRKVNGNGSDGSVGLGRLVQMWPTPCARDGKGARGNSKPRDSLDYAVERGQTKSKTFEPPPATGQLNPDWVEWLMGWPIGHTDLKPLVTGKFRSAPQ